MKKQFFCFFFIIILLINFECFAQNVSDTARIIRIETIDGEIYQGVVIYEDALFLVLKTLSLGDIRIPTEKIKIKTELKALKKDEASDKELSRYYLNRANLNHKFDVAKKIQKTGTILTISGISAGIIGIVMADYGWGQKTPTSDPNSPAVGDIGIFLFVVGIPVACVGVPMLIGGSIGKKVAKKKLQISLVNIRNPMNCNSIRGISIKLRF